MSDLVLVEREPPIAVVRLNRPRPERALRRAHGRARRARSPELDADDEVRCIVLGGDERAFAAGADIAELAAATAVELYQAPRVGALGRDPKALDAARGGRLGLVPGRRLRARDDVRPHRGVRDGAVRQPETGLGIIPGAGGTQRLARAVGKALAMDMVLTGRILTAHEALSAGLVARVVAREAWLDEARRVAGEIAARAPVAQRLAREAVDRAFETGLRLRARLRAARPCIWPSRRRTPARA